MTVNTDSRTKLPVGFKLNNNQYRIVKQLGSGAFSFVYEAQVIQQDGNLQPIANVAIKEFYSHEFSIRNELGHIVANESKLKPTATHEYTSLARTKSHNNDEITNEEGHLWSLAKAKKEISLLKQFSHPNIATYLSDFEENNTFYLVMELYSHQPTAKPKSPLDYFIQLLDTIASLHFKRIIHRDIHPKNILWDNNNNPVLIDFGLSMGDWEKLDDFTVTDSPYSPESKDGRYWLDTDLYSAAALTYRLIKGVPPPLLKDRDSKPLLLGKGRLDVVLNKAMSIKAKERYIAVEVILRDLQEPLTQIRPREDLTDDEINEREGGPVYHEIANKNQNQHQEESTVLEVESTVESTDKLPNFEEHDTPKSKDKDRVGRISKLTKSICVVVILALCFIGIYWLLENHLFEKLLPVTTPPTVPKKASISIEELLFNDGLVIEQKNVVSIPISELQLTDLLSLKKKKQLDTESKLNNSANTKNNTLYINYEWAIKVVDELNDRFDKSHGRPTYHLPFYKDLIDLANHNQLEDGKYLSRDFKEEGKCKSKAIIYQDDMVCYVKVANGKIEPGSAKKTEYHWFTLRIQRIKESL